MLQLGFAVSYEDAFLSNTRILLHPLARDLFSLLDICPSQLSPNGWRLLMGVAYLWPQYFKHELTLQDFLWTY